MKRRFDEMESRKVTKDQALVYQSRLSNLLRNYRLKNRLQSKEMAEYLGYAASRYCALESDKIPYDRFINSIDFIENLAQIEHTSISEFMEYLSGEDLKTRRTPNNNEMKLIEIFHQISTKSKNSFIESMSSLQSLEDRETLETVLKWSQLVKEGKISASVISNFDKIIESLTKGENEND